MYRPDGHGWDAQQEPRGNPDQYADDGYHGGGGGGGDNLHVGFQPSSAAFEYMRSLDSQSGGGGGDGGRMTPPPRPLHGGGMGGDYPPQPQRGQSPEHSPTAYGRQGRAPRRPRRTTRATGAGGGGPPTSQDDMIPGPLRETSRMVSDMPVSMPSPQPVMSGSGGPIFQDDDHDSSGPHNNASMPMPGGYGGRGPRGYDDPMSVSRPPLSSSSPYDNIDGPGGPPAPAGLHQDTSSGSFMPDAPYQNMMNTFNSSSNAPDAAVERARNIMASRGVGGVGGASGTAGDTEGSRPMPMAGRPMPPETPSIEPSVPPAQLRRRILTNKPKREPDLVRGKAVQQITSSSKKTHVLCSGCSALLQIPKSAIVVHCRNCNGVYPTASCQLPNVGR